MASNILEKVRRWIDEDSVETTLEKAARDAQVKARNRAEQFIVAIAQKIEAVIQEEMVPLPQGTVIIPREFTVFFSTDDDKEWQGEKRRGLEKGLYHILGERAREIAGKKKLETTSFGIEFRIDGTLEKGEIRVEHSWEDSTSNKTGVLVRPKGIEQIEAREKLTVQTVQAPQVPPPARIPPSPTTISQQKSPSTARSIEQAVPLSTASEAEEMTHVASRAKELYKLEVWRGGQRQNVIPIYQRQIVIGRGSKSKPVDIPLSGDVEISRRHLVIGHEENGSFWILNEGRNAAEIGSFELPAGQRYQLQPGMTITVCSYSIRVVR
ncbi:MAG: FHA domain-containing protein [Acidobacteria bacterium]|nr:FHA domain-containing protein [Acidobacteriota bacterium]